MKAEMIRRRIKERRKQLDKASKDGSLNEDEWVMDDDATDDVNNSYSEDQAR